MSAAASPAAALRPAVADPFEVLREITETHVAVLALIERAFDESPMPDLDALRARIAAMVDRLRWRVAEKSAASPESLLLPLVCLYDERVMVRAMEPRGEEHWQRLQRKGYAPDEDGGDLFFEKEREVLRRVARLGEGANPAERQEVTLLVALYRFCLAEGFQGRCSEAPERLDERRKQLDAALATLVPGPVSVREGPPASTPPSWFERVRRVFGAFLVVSTAV